MKRPKAIQIGIFVPKGIDGEVKLAEVMDEMEAGSEVIRNAPRFKGLSGYLATGFATEGESSDGFWDVTVELFQRLSIWWPVEGYLRLPVMTPWCIRDRSCRYDHGPEAWGSPREDGHFRDDNSIIKKLPLSLPVDAPHYSRFHGRKPWRGFTACHIWRDLPGGRIAGQDPWLYSFMPNLVWVPRPLSVLTDNNPRVMDMLARTSYERFREQSPSTGNPYIEYAWGELTDAIPGAGDALDNDLLAEFSVSEGFIERRLKYIDNFDKGISEILEGRGISKKIVCSRYTNGVPELAHGDLVVFRSGLIEYRDYVRECQ